MVALSDLEDRVGSPVRVKLLEQGLPLSGVLLGPVSMRKMGYRGDTFGIQVGMTTRSFEAPHVETVEDI